LVDPVVGAGGAVVGGVVVDGVGLDGAADADAWAAWFSRLPAWLMSVWYLPRSPALRSFCAWA
jgi:hypothetical protein